MQMPAPAPDDLRWSWPLGGGALMDLGCYCLHAIRSLAAAQGGEPELLHATAEVRSGLSQIDERASATFRLPNGAEATAIADPDGPWNFAMTATGTAGRLELPNFIRVHDDGRLIITTGEGRRVEHLGTTPSYAYQLEAFAGAVREGRPFPTTTADAVANMDLIDDCYRSVGLVPRGTALISH
jgi:predicted dehydrogenase